MSTQKQFPLDGVVYIQRPSGLGSNEWRRVVIERETAKYYYTKGNKWRKMESGWHSQVVPQMNSRQSAAKSTFTLFVASDMPQEAVHLRDKFLEARQAARDEEYRIQMIVDIHDIIADLSIEQLRQVMAVAFEVE